MSQFCSKHGMNSGDAVSDWCSFADCLLFKQTPFFPFP